MATRIFFEDFESYSVGTLPVTGAWDVDDFRDLPQVVATSIDGVTGPYAGNRMVRCNWDGTTVNEDPDAFENAVLDISDYTDELFVRIRYRPDEDADGGFKLLRIVQFGDYKDLFMGYQGGGSITSEIAWNGGNLGNEFFDTSTEEWHTYEAYLNHNGEIAKVWHDGILERNHSGLGYNETGRWSPLNLASNINYVACTTAANHVYIDNVEVFSDSTAGESCTGSMSDASIQADEEPATIKRGSMLGGL